jgi:hypothetical protein
MRQGSALLRAQYRKAGTQKPNFPFKEVAVLQLRNEVSGRGEKTSGQLYLTSNIGFELRLRS